MTSLAPPILVIACGAIARELTQVVRLDRLDGVEVVCLPAAFHNEPDRIPEAVRTAVRTGRERGIERILVGYADCGTGGRLDAVCADEGVERLPGAHCYGFFAGQDAFAQLQDEEPGTFYLTDYLARHVDRLVFGVLGLDRHPELRDAYFGNYRRVVHLAQTDDPLLEDKARDAARRLGLAFERRVTGYGELRDEVVRFAHAAPLPVAG